MTAILSNALTNEAGQTRSTVRLIAASFLMATAMLLGGSATVGARTDLVVELVAVPVLFATFLPSLRLAPGWTLRLPLIWMALVFLGVIAQLVPLPPAIWTNLPMRDLVLQTLEIANVPIGWMPLSLAPHLSAYFILTLIVPFTMFIATIGLTASERTVVVVVAFFGGLISVSIGQIQLLQPLSTAFTLYDETGRGFATGLFSNRNHFAADVYMLLPLTIGVALQPQPSALRRTIFSTAALITLLFMLLGLSISYSRAGVAFGVVGLTGTLLMAVFGWSKEGGGRPRILILALIAIPIVIGLQIGAFGLLKERGLVDTGRSVILSHTLSWLGAVWTTGTGFGTFPRVYMIGEPTDTVQWFYINHVHNDWLELALEGGIPAILLAAAFVGWLLWRIYMAWRPSSGTPDPLARAATFSLVCIMLHSALDYPLRTLALSSLTALLCALLCPAPPESRPAPAPPRRSHSRSGSSSSRSSRRTGLEEIGGGTLAAPTAPQS